MTGPEQTPAGNNSPPVEPALERALEALEQAELAVAFWRSEVERIKARCSAHRPGEYAHVGIIESVPGV